MILLWKLLRKHISISQLTGFFFANLFGLFIVLFSFQFYKDIKPVFSKDDGIIKPEYFIINKRLTGVGLLTKNNTSEFSHAEIENIRNQPFCRNLGIFTPSQYKVSCNLGLQGIASFGTEMFFESVPDQFVDVDLKHWKFNPDYPEIPIVIPRTYLSLYNFGFAQSQSLPKISEGLVGMLNLIVTIQGNGVKAQFPAKVVGFSSRLNTILVPESFIQWSNKRYSYSSNESPTRLIVEVHNPTDDTIIAFMNEKGYELETDKLDSGRIAYFLKLISFALLCVGLLICALSFYILMLSVFLLVQKNTEKLRNLLLIGYSPQQVAMPYFLLTMAMNVLVLVASVIILFFARKYYMQVIWQVYSRIEDTSILPSLLLGMLLLFFVTILNVSVIYQRIINIWKRKE